MSRPAPPQRPCPKWPLGGARRPTARPLAAGRHPQPGQIWGHGKGASHPRPCGVPCGVGRNKGGASLNLNLRGRPARPGPPHGTSVMVTTQTAGIASDSPRPEEGPLPGGVPTSGQEPPFRCFRRSASVHRNHPCRPESPSLPPGQALLQGKEGEGRRGRARIQGDHLPRTLDGLGERTPGSTFPGPRQQSAPRGQVTPRDRKRRRPAGRRPCLGAPQAPGCLSSIMLSAHILGLCRAGGRGV